MFVSLAGHRNVCGAGIGFGTRYQFIVRLLKKKKEWWRLEIQDNRRLGGGTKLTRVVTFQCRW
jgi:hypothetical protein